MIYVSKIENTVRFKIKTRHYIELLTPKTMKLLGWNKSKITKDENGENGPHLEITEVVIILYNMFNNDYQQDWKVLYTFVRNILFRQSLDVLPKVFHF